MFIALERIGVFPRMAGMGRLESIDARSNQGASPPPRAKKASLRSSAPGCMAYAPNQLHLSECRTNL